MKYHALCRSNVNTFSFFIGNLIVIDLEGIVLTPAILNVKKQPDKDVIKKRVSLVLKKLSAGVKLGCTCQASHGEAVASVEEKIEVNQPPMAGKCKLIGYT